MVCGRLVANERDKGAVGAEGKKGHFQETMPGCEEGRLSGMGRKKARYCGYLCRIEQSSGPYYGRKSPHILSERAG